MSQPIIPHVCDHFLQGRCRNGVNCRYSHIVQAGPPHPADPRRPLPPPPTMAPFNMGPMGIALPPVVGPLPLPPLPPGPPPASARVQPLPPPTAMPTQLDARPPCMFFAKGNCRDGDKCRFSHVLVAPPPPNVGRQPSSGESPPPPPPGSSLLQPPSVPPPAVAPAAAPPADSRPLCTFFAKGNCRDGAGCRFRHTIGPTSAVRAAPPPTVVTLSPDLPVVSIDVECVATGVQHHDRSVAQISLIDSSCMPRLNLYVRPERPVASYLTPLTGVTAELLAAQGVPLSQAMATLRAALPRNAVLVGQNIAKDVEWLGLVEGVDFGQMVDLAALLRCWNPKFCSYTYAAQDHYASVWLGVQRTEADAHDAVADAVISMRLFHAYTAIQHDATAVAAMAERVLATTPKPSFAKLHPEFEGCCMGNRQTCKCGAPFFS
jgi:DNA polymerase III epsilon subunit-like protein